MESSSTDASDSAELSVALARDAPMTPRGTVADETRRYVDSRPSIRDCLRYGVVNFTALARIIRKETGLPSQEAIEIALRRLRRQLQAESSEEEQLRSVLQGSHLEIRTHVGIVTVRGDLDVMQQLVVSAQRVANKPHSLVQIYQSAGHVTVLCDSAVIASILGVVPRSSVVHLQSRLSVLSIQSPEEVLVTPRVVGFLTEAIGRVGINCIEMISIHTETLIVLRPSDAIRALGILGDLLLAVRPSGVPEDLERAPRTVVHPVSSARRGHEREPEVR